ncbi:putative parathyroid hormone 2 receptor [Trichinella spiralis]|uniref:putative parathyroid hormone 2 receptor n=1 Tax=Trichinella spiralis TaxID=6334 RepID=UPI0001EFCE2E|nr:putative parathyroid hormone 2 receptor [Trichinella spiralis]
MKHFFSTAAASRLYTMIILKMTPARSIATRLNISFYQPINFKSDANMYGAEQQQVSVAGDALMISLRCSCCNALAIDSQMTVVMKKTGRLILNATKRYRTDGDKRTNQYTCLYMCWEEAGLQVTTSIEQQQQTKDWPLPTAGQQFLTAPPSTRTATAISYKTLANRLFTTADCTAATEQQQQQQQQQASKQAKQSSKQQEKIAIADQRWTTASKQH